MIFQIVISSIRNPFHLRPPKGHFELHIRATFGIMCKFALFMLAQPKALSDDTDRSEPIETILNPIFIPFYGFFFVTEKFHLHLFKFARTKNKIAWGNFIAKRFSNLSNAKGNF